MTERMRTDSCAHVCLSVTKFSFSQWMLMLQAVDHKVNADTSAHWMIRLRSAARSHPTFVFFPHAGGSPLSVGRLASALSPEDGIIVANLPRGGDIDDATPPNRVAVAVNGLATGFLALHNRNKPPHSASAAAHCPDRLVLVGNSYGALLAYEMAQRLSASNIPLERLVVSGFRSPILPCSDAPLYRLPLHRLRTELTARFGNAPGDGSGWTGGVLEPALRADLEACDTYRHGHAGPLAVPITVLHMCTDPSVSTDELNAWQDVTAASAQIESHAIGHFPWATHPQAVARILLRLAKASSGGHAAIVSPEATTIHHERGSV